MANLPEIDPLVDVVKRKMQVASVYSAISHVNCWVKIPTKKEKEHTTTLPSSLRKKAAFLKKKKLMI